MTFGFVARAGGSAGLRGARVQAVCGGSTPAETGWNLWGMLPHLLPQLLVDGTEIRSGPLSDLRHQRNRLVAFQRLGVQKVGVTQRHGIDR